jgi:hypothetical protein
LQGDYKGGLTILTAEKPTINVIVFMFSNMGINSRGLGCKYKYSRLFYYTTKKGNAPSI